MTRREFLKSSGAAGVAIRRRMKHDIPVMAPAPPLVDPADLAAFVDPLPLSPVAKVLGKRPDPHKRGGQLPFYRLPIAPFESSVHRDVPPTRFWGYGGCVPGPTIEVRTGQGVLVEWPNELPRKHFLPIDNNLMGAETDQPQVRTVVHLHGAKAPPESDGYPEDWYVPGQSRTYYYPNEQDAALLWYHDHAMGINRLNILAGMVGLYVVRDDFEDSLALPRGNFEIPLTLLDRMIRKDGQLYYPVSQRPESPWVPEFFGNSILVNGKILPYLEVAPRRYRFRILNGSNGRFYFLSLANGQEFHQIGTDQGLLSAPVALKRLNLAPGERADLIIDFAGHEGEQIVVLHSQAQLMQFRVQRAKATDTSSLPGTLRPIAKIPERTAVRTRELSLEELDNVVSEPMIHTLDRKRWHDPVNEKPVLGSNEIWSFVNTTEDTHPIHLHLVRFQILDRRAFDVTYYLETRKVKYIGDATPPDPNEAGWKDTVRVNPETVTRIIAKFEGYTGRYVWHCHILEHEDNEMMRPYEVIES